MKFSPTLFADGSPRMDIALADFIDAASAIRLAHRLQGLFNHHPETRKLIAVSLSGKSGFQVRLRIPWDIPGGPHLLAALEKAHSLAAQAAIELREETARIPLAEARAPDSTLGAGVTAAANSPSPHVAA